MSKKEVSQAVDKALSRLKRERAIIPPDYDRALSTGSVLLNLACTGRPHAGYVPGTYYYFVGDSNSGKSFFSMAALAEACLRPEYKDYSLVFDNVERGVQMNIGRTFGRALAERLDPPCLYQGRPWHSEQIEDFYLNLDCALERGPCVYVLDSMDGLSSMDEEKKFQELKKSRNKAPKGEEVDEGSTKLKGSYTDGKAKKNSAYLRQMLAPLEKTGSILIIISQTRDKVGSFIPGDKTKAGGRAPSFYSQVEVWSSVVGKIKKDVKGKARHVGNTCEFHVKRSRFTGHEVKVRVPIYFATGIDDSGSCVDYLITEGHWSAKKGIIDAPEFAYKGGREKLVQKIEESDREPELHQLVAELWNEIESESGVPRKRRYE